MERSFSRKARARVIFITGLSCMLVGCAVLLGSMVGSRMLVLGAFLVTMIGVVSAVLAVRLNKRSIYLFFACFFMLLGFFLILAALKILPFGFRQGWPLLAVFAGLALLPAGWHRFGRARVRYMVPAGAFIILGAALLVFSMDIIEFSFRLFMLHWWPFLVVLTGLILLLIALGTRKSE